MGSDRKRSSPYPPIGDYAFLADCHSTALVSREGSVDWCCMPRGDSGSVFGRLLDWQVGGYFRVGPRGAVGTRRRYLPDTLVLETTFETEGGEIRLLDCFTMRRGGGRRPHQQLLRIVEGVRGEVEVVAEVVPRFDYGAILPWVREQAGGFVVLGGATGLFVTGDVPLERQGRHQLAATFTVRAGERRRLSVVYRAPEVLDVGEVDAPDVAELDRRFDETVAWWVRWCSQGRRCGVEGDLVQRAAMVLKGLSNAPTGAIAAAATTSLPEAWGGSRNWDYRFTWIRDSVFTVRSLAELGWLGEADGFRRFVERSAAGSAEELQVLFGPGGERRLVEIEVHELSGYGGARPVRVGNAAATQLQLDMYGEVVDLAWRTCLRGHRPDDDYWEFLVSIVQTVCRRWAETDRGLWEVRGEPRHFVHSKVMCWSAIHHALDLARITGREAPVEEWRRQRDEIRTVVEQLGYDDERGTFVRSFGSKELDAALLLLPTTDFVDWRDERMIRTADAVAAELSEDGLLRRYPRGADDLDGTEGAFVACSFWLVECLAHQGRVERAREVLEKALEAGNDLGLFAEEFDATRGELLGNFPQGLSHLSLIAAAVALEEASR